VTDDERFLAVAVEQARLGRAEGGIPIGAALVVDGEVWPPGRNRRVQLGSAIRHGETDCLENAGRLPASTYARATMYTTLSPCDMCTGCVLLYGIPRVVLGENSTFLGARTCSARAGVEVVDLDSVECRRLMADFIAARRSCGTRTSASPARRADRCLRTRSRAARPGRCPAPSSSTCPARWPARTPR
jgi:cytosine deaminase